MQEPSMSRTPTLQRRNTYQLIVDQLLDDMAAGRLLPSDAIPAERILSERYSVGRSSVREALRMLESHQIIKLGKRGQYWVSEKGNSMVSGIEMLLALRQSNLWEIHQLRSLLEIECAGLAAKHHTAENLEEIRHYHQQVILTQKDLARNIDADVAFHVAIGRASHNGAYTATIMGVRHVLRDFTKDFDYDISESITQHQLIVEAIAARDVAASRKQVEKHMNWIKMIPKNSPSVKK